MKAYIFPGQGAQFTGMGLDLYENSPMAQELFEKANEIELTSIQEKWNVNKLNVSITSAVVTQHRTGC